MAEGAEEPATCGQNLHTPHPTPEKEWVKWPSYMDGPLTLLTLHDKHAENHRASTESVVRQVHGQVMTPSDVAAYMADLLDCKPGDTLLDPGAGLGILSHAAVQAGVRVEDVTLVELEAGCFDHLMRADEWKDADRVQGDFLDFAVRAFEAGRKWDRIISNPPYLNFHQYDRSKVDATTARFDIKMTKFSNLFSIFLLASAHLLNDGGRFIIISPTELFTTNYGAAALRQLPPGVRLEQVAVFEPEAEPFLHSLTTACISTFVRDAGEGAVRVRRITDRNSLQGRQIKDVREVEYETLLRTPKLVLNEAAGAVEAGGGTCALGDLIGVSRGIATGANQFFVLDENTRQRVDPTCRYSRRVVSRAESLGPRDVFTSEAHTALVRAGKPAWLLSIDAGSKEALPTPLRDYVLGGEKEGYHERFLCRNRRPWFSMERQTPPAAFVGVFNRGDVRVVKNEAGAVCLAACHRLYHPPSPQIDEPRLDLLLAFLRSTPGRSSMDAQARRYGRGLKKLEPGDLKRVHVPDMRLLSDGQVASFLQDLQRGRPVDDVMGGVNDAVGASAGLTTPPS